MGEFLPSGGNAFKTELAEFAHRRRSDGPYADNLDVDVLVIGAGFGKTSFASLWQERMIK